MSQENEQQIFETIRQINARQRINGELFEKAVVDNFVQDDIGLEKEYKEKTEFRQTPEYWLVQHKPTLLIDKWPAGAGPRSLKQVVERWVDLLDENVPPVPTDILDSSKS